MRFWIALLLVGCTPKVGGDQELCGRAAAMFEKCETLDGNKLQKSLTVDRWRGLCRAVLSGDTKQLMPNTLELYAAMDDETKRDLQVQARCQAAAETCAAYQTCSK
jgi:hypothetical protein